ncbi:MAG: hypothetical protein R3266_13095 [Gemmatimonadota bacterium]|nr:hypothetical protein [Gemmatimonadota bacterium]
MYEVRRAGAPGRRLPRAIRRARVAVAVALATACVPSQGVRLEPIQTGFEPTRWRSVELYETGADVQRDFVRVALIRVDDGARWPGRGTLERMRRRASEVGANALVLEELASDRQASSGPDGGGWSGEWRGVATAIRILDGRWGDRYWRFGDTPGPLAGSMSVEQPGSGWSRLKLWRGSGDRKTDAFSVPDGEWRVLWHASPAETGSLEILIHRLPGDVLTARIGQDGGGAGSYLGLAGAGTYYLSVRGEGLDWEVAVDTWTSGAP